MRRGDVLAAAGLMVPPGIVIGLHIYIGSFNRMLGDDYCTTYMAERLGLFRSLWFWYRTWHGRFSANVADWLISLFGPGGYPVYTFIFLATWVLFAVIAVRMALDAREYVSFKLAAALLLAVLLVFTTLSLTPDIIESLFWWGGVRSYLSPLILIVLYFAFYFRFLGSGRTAIQTNLGLVLSFGLALFMGGFSETFTPVLVVLFAGLMASAWLVSTSGRKADASLFLSAGFIGALLSLIVMISAPGNSIRRAYFPVPPDVFTTLRIASASYLTFLSDMVRSPYALTGLLGSTLGSIWLGMRLNRESGISTVHGWWIVCVLVMGFILAFACFPTAVYATYEPPPARTLITPAFILAVCFLFTGFAFGEWLPSRGKSERMLVPLLLVLAYVSITFSASGTAQRLYAMRDVHIEFAQRWDRVDAQIRAAKASGLREVVIPSLTNWADAAFPTDNPRYWPNVCYSKFYDINIVAPPLQPE